MTEPPYVAPVLVAREGSGAVIDRERGFIYGLEEDLNYQTLTTKYLEVYGDGSIYAQKTYWMGTGTRIQLVDRDGTVLETLTLVIFGDLNGDAVIKADDVIVLKGLISGAIDEQANPAVTFAADMNADQAIGLTDRNTILGISTGAVPNYSQSRRTTV